jgi:dUTPase
MSNLKTTLLKLNLLNYYDKVMVLKVYIDNSDHELHNKYVTAVINHNNNLSNNLNNNNYIDAGFDLFTPKNGEDEDDNNAIIPFFQNKTNKLNYKICCSAKMYLDTGKSYNTGYYMYPRSSISKIPLRLANNVGIIDAGYRGHLIGMFDVLLSYNNKNISGDYFGNKYDRYLQICSPGLEPIIVEIVERKEDLGNLTIRGDGGFGSSGV